MLAFLIAADAASGIAGGIKRFIRWIIPTRKELRGQFNWLVAAGNIKFAFSLICMIGVCIGFFMASPWMGLGAILFTVMMYGRTALYR